MRGIAALACIFCLIGAWQLYSRIQDYQMAARVLMATDEDNPTSVEGTVVSYLSSATSSQPDYFLLKDGSGIRYQVTISTLATRSAAASLIERGIKYGDVLRIEGFVSAVALDTRWITGAHVRVSPRTVDLIWRGDHSYAVRLVRALYSIRAHVVETLIVMFGERHGGLLAGLIVEGGALIDSDTKKIFQKTGLSHIVALSGYNTSIIIDFSTMVLATVLPRRMRIVTTGGLAILFCTMTGASPPLLRASIMALLRLIADMLYRRFNAFRALIFSACCIAAHNPFLVAYSLSFQLSFLATLGLIVFAHPLQRVCERYVRFVPRFISQTFSTTVAAQIYTLPLLIYRFRGLSIISFVSNVVVLPVIPFFMLASAVSVVASDVQKVVHTGEFFVNIFAAVITACVDALLYVITFMANIHYAYVYASLHPATLLFMWAAGVGGGFWLMRRKRSELLPRSS